MAQIIEFPDLTSRQWRDMEPAIEEVLQRAAAPPEMRTEVKTAMKAHVEKISKRFDGSVELRLPGHLDSDQVETAQAAVRRAVSEVASWFHGIINQMLIDLLRLECELYLARQRASSPE